VDGVLRGSGGFAAVGKLIGGDVEAFAAMTGLATTSPPIRHVAMVMPFSGRRCASPLVAPTTRSTGEPLEEGRIACEAHPNRGCATRAGDGTASKSTIEGAGSLLY